MPKTLDKMALNDPTLMCPAIIMHNTNRHLDMSGKSIKFDGGASAVCLPLQNIDGK